MKTKRIHVFQHVAFEGPGSLTTWFKQNNFPVEYTRFYEPAFKLPELASFDQLIVMGGPMGVNDEVDYPWLKEEKELIKAAIKKGKTVVGICLGAQLIASALGKKVFPNKHTEIGWFPILKTKAAEHEKLVAGFQQATQVFHWHGDTFDLPEQAKHLFYSEACPNQAFLIGNKVLGLQFHLEVEPDSLEGMLENAGNELLGEFSFIQSKESIRANIGISETNTQLLYRMMDLLD
ncbi:type 1 glutamine amidotransferase [Mangrovibacterium sp.]|uniref:type 1 glutamine amidotransferase n=1 Tax=Mangrovibacterium sp. TaxID=1961364 RepID=UPI00356381B0